MNVLSIASQVAMSYLNDIDSAIERLKNEDNCYIRERMAKEIISGDIRLARGESEKIEPDLRPAILANCDFCEARIWMAVASGHAEFYALENSRHESRTAASRARQCLLDSIEKKPIGGAYYNLALVLEFLDRKPDALHAYEEAIKLYEEEGDTSEAIEARKAIGRMGNVRKGSATDGTAGSFGVRKEINGGLLKKGIVVSVIGLLIVKWLAPVLIIGIGMVVYSVAVGRKY